MKDDAIFDAVQSDDAESVGHLVRTGADPNALVEGVPLLTWAVTLNYPAVAEVLLEHGALVDGRDAEGFTPLMNAAFAADQAMVTKLIAAGADVNAVADSGITALISASKRGCRGIVEALLKSGANCQARDQAGNSALHCAVTNGDFAEVAEALLEAGASVDAVTDGTARTPLMLAALMGHQRSIDVLLASGASVDALGLEEPFTAADLALSAGRADIAQLLSGRH